MARMRKAKQVKTPLFDRIFKPQMITLANGHSVARPRSRMPLIAGVLLLSVFVSLYVTTKFDFTTFISKFKNFTDILKQVFHPTLFQFTPSEDYFARLAGMGVGEKLWRFWACLGDWMEEYYTTVFRVEMAEIMKPLLETIKMSVMGSVIGSTISLPFAVFASANINKNGAVVAFLRLVLNIVRTLPTLVIANICALIFKLGAFAGTVAIAVFTFGVVCKMLYESIETIDMGPFEAMESFGASRVKAFWSACMPQILPTYLSHCLYSFEMNIRAASILGYVGAGGLGILISEHIGWRDYNALGSLLLCLFITVLVIDNLSQYLRKKLS